MLNRGGYCMNCAIGGDGFKKYETSVGELEFCSDYCWEQFDKPSESIKVASGVH